METSPYFKHETFALCSCKCNFLVGVNKGDLFGGCGGGGAIFFPIYIIKEVQMIPVIQSPTETSIFTFDSHRT